MKKALTNCTQNTFKNGTNILQHEEAGANLKP